MFTVLLGCQMESMYVLMHKCVSYFDDYCREIIYFAFSALIAKNKIICGLVFVSSSWYDGLYVSKLGRE